MREIEGSGLSKLVLGTHIHLSDYCPLLFDVIPLVPAQPIISRGVLPH